MNPKLPPTNSASTYPGFTAVGDSPGIQSNDQNPTIFCSNRLHLVATPPGVSTPALIKHFAEVFSGRGASLFGPAPPPGNALVLSHSILQNLFSMYVPIGPALGHQVHLRKPERPFNWRIPLNEFKFFAANERLNDVSAILIDGGPIPADVDEAIVLSAKIQLNNFSRYHNCPVLIFVEYFSDAKDPYQRVPKPLRGIRDPLLVCSLRPRDLNPETSAWPEFLLFKLVHHAPASLNIRFRVSSSDTGALWINWGEQSVSDPREAFRVSEAKHLYGKKLIAARFAFELLRREGPKTKTEIIRRGLQQKNIIFESTMSEALTDAAEFGYLQHYRRGNQTMWSLQDIASRLGNYALAPTRSGLFS